MARNSSSAYEANNKIVQNAFTHVRYEAVAASTITPGDILAYDSNLKVARNATVGQRISPRVAVESRGTHGSVGLDGSYAADDMVPFMVLRPGDRALLKLANGESVTKGGYVQPAASGKVAAFVADDSSGDIDNFPIAVALETIDMSDSSSADPTADFILCEII